MATIACSFGGRTSYDNGWAWKYFNTATGYGHSGFGKDYYGHNRCIVLKITTPALPSTYINRKLTIVIPMCRSSYAGSGTDTFHYRVSTVAPSFSEGGVTQITFPSSYICDGTVDIYNTAADYGYGLRTITTNVANFVGDTTYYIWLWSDTPYVYGSTYYVGYYGHHPSCGGLISVNVDYTLQQKSTLTVTDGTLGTAQNMSVTQQMNTMTHTIGYSCGSASGTICTKSSNTSISWTPPLSLASQNTMGASVSITFTITTYSGDTDVGSNSYTKTFAIPSTVAPSCTIAVTDPTGYSNQYGGFLKSLSKLQVVVTPTLAYGSAIASYKTTANGLTYNNASFTTDVLTSSGSLTIASTVKDNRGCSGSATKSITVLDYSPPSVTSLKVKRCDQNGKENNQGAYVQVTFSAAVTSLNNLNSAVYALGYKQTSATEYTAIDTSSITDTYSANEVSFIFPADTGASYNIKLTVTDDFKAMTTTTTASTAFTLMHWLKSGLGMAIGKIAELTNVLDIGFQTKFSGGILQPVLEDSTDFNQVMTPNTYTLRDTNAASYTNCPLPSGSKGILKVESCGESGEIKQTVTLSDKTCPSVYERLYSDSAWGDWLCDSTYGFKPYYTAGDTLTTPYFGSSFITGGGKNIYFTLPLAKPVVGCTKVTATSCQAFIRQGGNYLYGSTSTSPMTPDSITASILGGGNSVGITLTMSNTTNVVNNDVCGLHVSTLSLAFS